MSDELPGRVVNGIELGGRSWTIFLPAAVLKAQFGLPQPSDVVFRAWTAERGSDVFGKAIARAWFFDDSTVEAVVGADDL